MLQKVLLELLLCISPLYIPAATCACIPIHLLDLDLVLLCTVVGLSVVCAVVGLVVNIVPVAIFTPSGTTNESPTLVPDSITNTSENI